MEEYRHNKGCDKDCRSSSRQPEGYSDELITYVTDRLGHDMRYAIDSRKLQKELGWEPSCSLKRASRKQSNGISTIRSGWMDNITSGDYERYYEDMYSKR